VRDASNNVLLLPHVTYAGSRADSLASCEVQNAINKTKTSDFHYPGARRSVRTVLAYPFESPRRRALDLIYFRAQNHDWLIRLRVPHTPDCMRRSAVGLP